jgi:endonuclease YncB( thermonuclease family)
MRFVTIAITMFLAAPASAFEVGQVIEGPAEVVDGDTLVVDDQAIRLQGVQAADRGQPLSREATDAMKAITAGRTVRCSLTGETTYNRAVATCWVGSNDVAAQLVAAGMAIDCPAFSRGRYAALETAEARATIVVPRFCKPRQGG